MATNQAIILQWNCNGFYKRLHHLQRLITYYQPKCICLQETHFKINQTVSLKKYSIFRTDRQTDGNASGGVAILIDKEYHSKQILINTTLEVTAVQLASPLKHTLCNIYLPPNKMITYEELANIINQLPKPYIVVGDFNGHNQIWGSTTTDQRGKMIEQLIHKENIVILNEGNHTRLDSGSGTFTAIDLSLCDPKLAPNINWEVIEDQHDSDHFPIKLTIRNNKTGDTQSTTQQPKWNFKAANWDLFRTSGRP